MGMLTRTWLSCSTTLLVAATACSYEVEPGGPIAGVHADWATIEAAGFPLQHREMVGGHDGVGEDWSGSLIAIGKTWVSP